jgi:OPA family glycerol-3-phosphate transporter-like MFS transporter
MSTGSMHTRAFRFRRAANWLPLGLTYAFLYMGRYNLTVAKYALGDLMTLEQFGIIFGVGTTAYAFSFLINGPLTDKYGGRLAILIAALGSGICNLVMGFYIKSYIVGGGEESPTLLFSIIYATNMYFQSFGAVAIVKVNSNWFHVTERGTFSAIFGIMISSGIFLAFDVGFKIVMATQGIGPDGVDATWWVFFAPSIALLIFFFIDLFLVRNNPSDAGQKDFDTGAAILSDDDEPLPTLALLKKILTNPIIMTVAAIEFCTGILRNGIMHWYPLYAKSTVVLPSSHFMMENWGLILMIAGIAGGAFAGLVSDKLFQSRRGPAAGALYAGMAVAVFAMIFTLGGTNPEVEWIKTPPQVAYKAGLEKGDLILSVDGKAVTDVASLVETLGSKRPGAKKGKERIHEITYLRKDRKHIATIKVGFREDDDGKKRKALLKAFAADTSIKPVKDVTLENGKKGAALRWIAPPGLRSGDIILGLGDKTVQDRARFITTLDTPGQYDVKVLRNGKSIQARLTVDRDILRQLKLRKYLVTLKDFDVGDKTQTVLLWKGEWAFEAGLRKGDRIESVNGTELSNWNDFRTALKTDGTANELVITRGNETIKQSVVYPKHAPQSPNRNEQQAKYIRAGPTQTLSPYVLGFVAFFISLCVIGTHGLLSGTATMDFGGKRGAATAVGVIDGFVYLGTAVQSFSLGYITTHNWSYWPIFLLPFAFIGFFLCLKIWNAKPRSGGGH